MNLSYDDIHLKFNDKSIMMYYQSLILSVALIFFSMGSIHAQGFVRSTTKTGIEVSWFERCLPYSFDPAGSQNLSMLQIQKTADLSFGEWAFQECTNLAFSNQGIGTSSFGFELGAHNENLIIFRSTPNTWVHDPNILGLTTLTMCQNESPACPAGTILDGDIELNEAHFNFTASDQAVSFDLENTLTHEIGHLIGFDHSLDENSTMYASAPEGEIEKRDLNTVDIDGLCLVYPSDGTGTVCEGTVEIGLPYPDGIRETDVDMGVMNVVDTSFSESGGCQQGVNEFSMILLMICMGLFVFIVKRSPNL
jgi:hypothetical protein